MPMYDATGVANMYAFAFGYHVSCEAAGMPAHLPAQIKQAFNTLHSIATKGAATDPQLTEQNFGCKTPCGSYDC